VKSLLVVLLLVSSARADITFDNRTTLTAAFGLVAMQVDGVTTSGMLVQPTFTRVFDRFELQADYFIADVREDSNRMDALVHRFGFAARYQVARARADGLTLDLIVEGGIGLQYISLDNGDAYGRNDLEVGIGLRMLSDVTHGKRVFMGLDAMLRGLVTPEGDKAFVFAFGVPFGR
jgi:hypothetical protein